MNITKIDGGELYEYISQSFKDDLDLYKYYDFTVNVSSIDDMVNDTYLKILSYDTHFKNTEYYGVNDNLNKAGYFFVLKEPNCLVSFSLNNRYRKADSLKQFFDFIKTTLDEDFICYMNECNTRGIKWLEKCGMEKLTTKDFVTILNYKKCL